jgi:malate dehydrogenase (oxaloacetate-decarboxylating)
VTKILLAAGAINIILLDTRGAIWEGRGEGMNWAKDEIAKVTNKEKIKGGLAEAIRGADMFIGLSQPGLLTQEMVRTMAVDPIIFAMANPVPEIMPEEAKAAGARLVATGRSDYSNQINNVLAFPGLFCGVLNAGLKKITMEMKIAAACALAGYIKEPTADYFIPRPFDPGVADTVAKAVVEAAK